MYISGIGCISPQNTIGNRFFYENPVEHQKLFLQCIQPESYKDYINPVLSRRLSRIIKMGITSALMSLREAGIENPGAVITGTGLGCVEDTEKFLMTMLDNNETLMNPTNFMQSTYNTISSQIAIILKCYNYNSTYVHRGFSFESALIDAMDLMNTSEAENALIGGIDEFTQNHYDVTSLTGIWRQPLANHLELLKSHGIGTIPGEGSVFFTLTKNRYASTYARIAAVDLLYKPDSDSLVIEKAVMLLNKAGIMPGQIDLVISGINGDERSDIYYFKLVEEIFGGDVAVAGFKNLCGEYYTASAFGLWLAANCIKRQVVPDICFYSGNSPDKIKNILFYNHYSGQQHSLMLLTID